MSSYPMLTAPQWSVFNFSIIVVVVIVDVAVLLPYLP